MSGERIKTLGLVALLSLSIISFAAMDGNFGLQKAEAVGETITPSKTTFFGANVVEITITDDTLEDNNDPGEEDEITVTFDVSSGGTRVVEDVTVGDDAADISAEIGDSGKFVFYITADDDVTVGQLDDPEFGSDSQLIFIGEDGDVDIGTDTENDAFDGADDGISLNEGATIQITYEDTSMILTYQNQKAALSLDRTAVGSDGFIYLTIEDQDSNNDPTGRDELNFDGTTDALTMTFAGVPDDNLGQIIFDAGIDFSETTDNSSRYEVKLSVEDVLGIDAADTPKSVVIRLQDFDAYPNDPFYGTAAGFEGTDDVSRSVLVDNGDGILQEVTNPASPRSELTVKVNDPDRNLDSKVKDRIIDALVADLSSGSTDDSDSLARTPANDNTIDLIETGTNTGLFVPDTPDNLIEVTIDTAVTNDGIVQIDSAASAKSDILVKYADLSPDDAADLNVNMDGVAGNEAKEIQFKGKTAANTLPVLSLGQTRIGAQDKVYLVLADQDLNDDAESVDTFELIIPAGSFDDGMLTVEDVEFNGVIIGDLELDSIVNGDDATNTNPVADIILSFQETGDNTGIFAAEFEYELLASTETTDDGDNTEFTWFDNLLESPLESSARLTIGEPDRDVAWQINEFGLPFTFDPETNADIVAKRTKVKLLITDPSLNQDSSTVETKTLTPVADADALTIHIEGADGSVLVSGDDIAAECTGFGSTTFTETGANTGIFDKTLDVAGNACGLDPEDLANAKLIAEYSVGGDNEEASTVFKGYAGKITSDSRTIVTGQEIIITVNDPDQNKDRDVVEQVKIEIEPDGLASTFETLDETGTNTGVFQKKLKVGEDFDILDDEEVVDEVIMTYIDAVSSGGGELEERELTLLPPSSTATLIVNPERIVGPQTEITIQVVDVDLNDDPNMEDTIDFDVLEISTDNDEVGDSRLELGEGGFEMDETGINTGVFEVTLTLVPITPEQKDANANFEFTINGDEVDLPAEPGDKIAITYQDENHGSDGKDVISIIINVVSVDPVITTDKESYLPNDIMVVTIEDLDADTDPDIFDTIEDIEVFSDRDPVGERFDATETGTNTGIFRFEVPLVEDFQNDALNVRIGDVITIRYNDQFPADYAERIEDIDDPDRDFEIQVPVGRQMSSTETTTPTSPELKDIRGTSITEVTAGTQVIISTTVTNNNDEPQPAVVLVEVRNADGITVYLQWQTGTINADDEMNIGLSWTPDAAGTYQLRTFVLGNLLNPSTLSPVVTSTVTVS